MVLMHPQGEQLAAHQRPAAGQKLIFVAAVSPPPGKSLDHGIRRERRRVTSADIASSV